MMAGVGLLLMLWCWCRCRDVGAELELVQFLMDEADSRCNYLFVVSLNWRERERETLLLDCTTYLDWNS